MVAGEDAAKADPEQTQVAETEAARETREHAAAAPPLPAGPDSTRVDRWLWAVRLLKTRPEAAQACRAGHVRVNDRPAKPATAVRVGDLLKMHVHGVTRTIEVGHVLEKRVAAPVAARCLIDHTPAPAAEKHPAVPRRARGAGRPTKRERRQLDKLRGED